MSAASLAVSAAQDMLPALYALGAATAVLAIPYAASRRVRRVTGAVMRFTRARAPRWLVPALAVCAFVPGPLDEAFVLGVVLYPVLRSAEARRELGSMVRAAWNS